MRDITEWAIAVAFCVLICYGIVQWLSGCGEHYIDHKGVTHTNQCN